MTTLSFANAAGFLALLGIPAILAVHFLQRESRRVTTSTLFLFENLSPISARGRRWERLRNSAVLWLQLLAVLLITWLLAQPRWLRADSTQSVSVLLDSSVSMGAFRDSMLLALRHRLGEIAGGAARSEWTLLESDPSRPTLYSGKNLNKLLEAAAAWVPALGAHDAGRTLQSVRSLQPSAATVLFVSDHKQSLPAGVDLLAVGEPIENCGFIGLRARDDSWTALIKNHGAQTQSPQWWVEPGGHQRAAVLSLAAGQTQAISGRFPEGVDSLTLALSDDRFPTDDRLPIVRPLPKTLNIAIQPGTPLDAFFQRLAGSISHVKINAASADLRLAAYDPTAPSALPEQSLVFVAEPGESKNYLSGDIVAENHPLTADLNWRGLLCKKSLGAPAREGDEVLLWQGGRPLIFLRGRGAAQSLVVNFDLRQSNADRLPSFILLLHRHAERIRSEKIQRERGNFESNQRIEVAHDRSASPPLVWNAAGESDPLIRAPAHPQFFQVRQDESILLDAASHFADSREADFHNAATADSLDGKKAEMIERNSREDFLKSLSALLLGLVLIGTWACNRETP